MSTSRRLNNMGVRPETALLHRFAVTDMSNPHTDRFFLTREEKLAFIDGLDDGIHEPIPVVSEHAGGETVGHVVQGHLDAVGDLQIVWKKKEDIVLTREQSLYSK